MQRLILDSCVLVDHWRRCWSQSSRKRTAPRPRDWAAKLIELYRTDAIVTPVSVEFLVGFTNSRELEQARIFLQEFHCVDEQDIPKDDWHHTLRLARRIPHHGKPRQIGDCLIRAIADRLRYDVHTADQGFPK